MTTRARGAIVPPVASAAHTTAARPMPGGTDGLPTRTTVPPAPLPRDGGIGKYHRAQTAAQLEARRAWGAEWGPKVGASIRAYIAERTGD